MIFSSYKFVFLFLPIVFGVYWILNKLKLNIVSKIWLVFASFFFYAQGTPDFLPFFMGSVFFNYLIGSTMNRIEGEYSKWNKKILLIIGILANVGLLGYFKYTDFFITNINYLSGLAIPLTHIILPIGISFFTFQLIAYLVDTYRGETKEYSILSYLLFITFFPQLIVGPIVHHKDVAPQFENEREFKIRKENLVMAIFLFSIGCAKKLLLADPMTEYAESYFLNGNILVGVDQFWQSWLSTITYTVSYYFDLSGYADMAIGLGYLFNIKLPKNFNSPYKARNFADYWQRWHMTLSKFLSDYIFRSVYKKGAGSANYYLAVMVTFLVSGFWHGAGWNFIVWGLINGLFVVSANFMKRKGLSFPFIIAHLLTLLGVMGTRVLFVAKDFNNAFIVYKSMLDLSVFSNMKPQSVWDSLSTYLVGNGYSLLIMVVGLIIVFFVKNSNEMAENISKNFNGQLQFSIKHAVLAGFILAVSIFWMGGVSRFLYFQF